MGTRIFWFAAGIAAVWAWHAFAKPLPRPS